MNKAARLGLLALLTGGFAGGCSCDEGTTPSEVTVRFVTPEQGATIGCLEDSDRESHDLIQANIEVEVDLDGIDGTDFIARIRIEGEDGSEREGEIDVDGAVRFLNYALEIGEIVVVVEILDGGEVVASAVRNLLVEFDPEDEACQPDLPPVTVTFVEPASALGAGDDGDGNLGNGLQVDVVLAIDGSASGPATLTVEGTAAGEADFGNDDRATFAGVTLDIGSGMQRVALRATVPTSEGDVVVDHQVDIAIDACALTFEPPMGCVGGDQDVDPADGVQIDLSATSNCAEVTFIVNGDETTVDVVAGTATARVTLDDGDNTLQARASNPGGLGALSAEAQLAASASIPTAAMDLDEQGDNILGREQGEAADDDEYTWTLTGTATGLTAGDSVSLDWDPALPGAPDEADVAGDGTFSVEVTTDWYRGTVQATATDGCGAMGASVEYDLTLDAVVPVLTLVAPEDPTITVGDDAEPAPDGRAGVQFDIAVTVEDPRPVDVDYTIIIQCTDAPPAFVDRYTDDADADGQARSDLADGAGTIRATFPLNESGTLNCRAFADTGVNAIDPAVIEVELAFLTPTFTITDPRQPPGGIECLAGEVVVGGNGEGLDGAVLNALVVTGEEPAIEAQLSAEGEGQFAARFGAEGGPDALADGRYRVTVEGTAQGGADVAVIPEDGVEFIVDNTAPVLALTAPALDAGPLGIDADANMNLADCVQTGLTMQLVDASASRVCYSLNGGVERCGQVDGEGFFAVAEVTLLAGDNELVISSVDCAGNEGRAVINLPTMNCAPRIEIETPPDGASLAFAGLDLDDIAPGAQIDVTVRSALPENTPIEVVVDGADAFGPVPVDAGGSGVVRVTVNLPAPDDREAAHPFTLQPRSVDMAAIGPVSSLSVLFQPPTLTFDDLGVPCVNGDYVDASVEDGFQIALTASSERLPEGADVALQADCGTGALRSQGVVAADGSVEFAPLTVPVDATCQLVAAATDAADQVARGETEFVVDRVAPTVQMLFPENDFVISVRDDEDQRPVEEAAGIQATVRVRVCGAGGQTVTVGSEPALEGTGDLELDDERDCAEVELPRQTMPLGALAFDVTVADACGNETVAVSNATVDSGANILVLSPDDNARINTDFDLDGADGCQLVLSATAIGFPAGTPFTACTNVDTGEDPHDACGGGWSAMGPAGCVAVGNEQGFAVSCDLNLPEAAHALTVVGINNNVRVESGVIDVTADCEAPSVVAIGVTEDANDDACLNRQERANASARGNTSAFTVTFETEGVEDGESVELRRDPGGVFVQRVDVQDNVGSVDLAGHGAGEWSFWLRGTDANGNDLPEPGDAGAIQKPLTIDPFVPVPLLLNIAAAQCLSGADDAGGDPDLQYAVDAQPGGQPGEAFTAQLYIDGQQVEDLAVDTDQFSFAPTTIGEGPHTLAYTAIDPCGNVGSAAGFDRANGLDDWNSPRTIAFSVDTVPPVPVLGGLMDGAVLGEIDDANGNAADGFQSEITVTFDPLDGIEAGQEVRLFSGAQGVAIAGAPLLVPEGLAAPIDATITLPPGGHQLTLRASDVCGNEGTSAEVGVTVNIDGCASVISTFAQNPATVGPAAGQLDGETLEVDLEGTIDLFNPDCLGASAQMVVNGVPAGPQVVVPGSGEVALANVPLPRGENQLALRVTFDGGQTDSAIQTVNVDLGTAAIAYVSPAGAEPVAIVGDSDPVANGQQTTVVVSVTEDQVDSPRTATLDLDGQQVGQLDVAAGSPVQVSFIGVTVPPGPGTFEVCVNDGGDNEACEQIQFNADPSDPAALADLAAAVVDRRSTEVEFSFTAPGDDAAGGGPVARYEIRRADAEIVDEAGWDNADLVDSVDFDAQVHAAPGADETLAVEDLELNKRHFVSVRGIDDVGRMSAVNSVEVDLRFDRQTWNFDASVASGGPDWGGAAFFNPKSVIRRVGDVDQDGFDDIVFAASRDTGTSRAVIIFGAADPADADTRELGLPAPLGGVFWAADSDALGDINGDGAPDFGVLGFAGDFTTSVGLYFGTPGCVHPADTAACRDAIAAPSSYITTTERASTAVNGIGNFNHLPGDAVPFDDILIGGDPFGGSTVAFVVAGRAVWPANIAVAEGALDRANGITAIEVPEESVAQYAASAGDTNGDNYSELVFSAGGSINDSYRFVGGLNLAETYVYNAQSADTVKLASPCEAAPQGFGTGFVGGVQLDGEGGPDFVMADRDSKRVIVFNHALQSTDCFGRNERFFGSVMDHVGDIDGDGFIDLVISHNHPNEANTDAWIYYNDGFGQFGIGAGEAGRVANATLDLPGAKKLGITSAGDFTNNGLVDIAAVTKGALADDPAIVVLYYNAEN